MFRTLHAINMMVQNIHVSTVALMNVKLYCRTIKSMLNKIDAGMQTDCTNT